MHLNSDMFSIMLVEDEKIDAVYFKKSLVAQSENMEVSVFSDGDDAIDYLQELAKEGIRQFPDLIILDLNMPVRSGFEVIEEIRGDPRLMTIPIIVVSTSSAKRDVQKAYRMKVNAFVRKPDDLTGYDQVANAICHFWRNTALLP